MSQGMPTTGRWRPRGRIGRLFQGLITDVQQLDAEDLQEDVSRAGAAAVSTCTRGEHVTVMGRLRSVVYMPRETVPTVEAELFDGSGSVRLVWLGRRRIAGIEPGRSLTARGRMAQQDGEFVLYNPWYELQLAAS